MLYYVPALCCIRDRIYWYLYTHICVYVMRISWKKSACQFEVQVPFYCILRLFFMGGGVWQDKHAWIACAHASAIGILSNFAYPQNTILITTMKKKWLQTRRHRVVCFVVARWSFRTWSSSRTWATGRWRRAPPTSAPCPSSPGAALTTHVTSSCPPTITRSRCSRAWDGQCSHIARLFQPLACYSRHTLL